MSIIKYYNDIATSYDHSRFENSYGKYINEAERAILNRWLKGTEKRAIIDLGCGTGRLLDYAMTGLDGSEKMLAIAAAKYPHHTFIEADITHMPENMANFEVGICFHVLMHLDRASVRTFFANASKIIHPNGRLVVDFLAAPRRQLLNKVKTGWHGNTDFSLSDIAEIIQPNWKVKRWQGMLMIPIHKFPPVIRPSFAQLDALLCNSPLASYASYYVVELEKIT